MKFHLSLFLISPIDNNSALVQVMAWCRAVASRYVNQYLITIVMRDYQNQWRSIHMTPCGVTESRCVKKLKGIHILNDL